MTRLINRQKTIKDYAMILIRNQKGTAIIELAIALPFILILLCGTIEFGALYYNKQIITNASREGVRAGITGINDTTIKTIVKDYSDRKLISLKDPISVTDGNIRIISDGNDLKVSVNITYTFLFSQIIKSGNKITLSASTVMRKESI
jgi:Flp pilus assembly protein TadG